MGSSGRRIRTQLVVSRAGVGGALLAAAAVLGAMGLYKRRSSAMGAKEEPEAATAVTVTNVMIDPIAEVIAPPNADRRGSFTAA